MSRSIINLRYSTIWNKDRIKIAAQKFSKSKLKTYQMSIAFQMRNFVTGGSADATDFQKNSIAKDFKKK